MDDHGRGRSFAANGETTLCRPSAKFFARVRSAEYNDSCSPPPTSCYYILLSLFGAACNYGAVTSGKFSSCPFGTTSLLHPFRIPPRKSPDLRCAPAYRIGPSYYIIYCTAQYRDIPYRIVLYRNAAYSDLPYPTAVYRVVIKGGRRRGTWQ